MAGHNIGRGKFAGLLLLLQGLLLILFVVFVDYDKSILPEEEPGLERDIDNTRRLDTKYGGKILTLNLDRIWRTQLHFIFYINDFILQFFKIFTSWFSLDSDF